MNWNWKKYHLAAGINIWFINQNYVNLISYQRVKKISFVYQRVNIKMAKELVLNMLYRQKPYFSKTINFVTVATESSDTSVFTVLLPSLFWSLCQFSESRVFKRFFIKQFSIKQWHSLAVQVKTSHVTVINMRLLQ